MTNRVAWRALSVESARSIWVGIFTGVKRIMPIEGADDVRQHSQIYSVLLALSCSWRPSYGLG